MKAYKKNLILFFAIIVIALLFWSSVSLQNYFYDVVLIMENYAENHELMAFFVFIFFSVFSAMFFMFSSIWLVPAAIFIWGEFLTANFLFVSWIIGAALSYSIARYAGYLVFDKIISSGKISRYRDFFRDEEGFWMIFLLRLVLPSEIPGYAMGVIGYNFGKYLLATALAELPYAFLTVFLIDSIINQEPTTLIILAGIWLIATSILTKILYSKFKKEI